MTPLFVDTAGWACIADKREDFHAPASAIYRESGRQKRLLITTNWIITETVALLSSRRLPRLQLIGFIETIKTAPLIEIVHITPELDEAAWQLLQDRPDKEWSLVDCASFVLMQKRGLREVLTTDHHFDQAGFVRLLRQTAA